MSKPSVPTMDKRIPPSRLRSSHWRWLAPILLLASSRLVPYPDIVFALLASLYFSFMSRLIFPPVTTSRPPTLFSKSRAFPKYVIAGGFVGLFFPLPYILAGFVTGEQGVIQAAVPHTFLLLCQVFTEQTAYGSDAVSLPVRALIPISYSTRRLFTISDWIRTAFGRELDGLQSVSANRWLCAERVLSIANMAFWSFNLFCFLLPIYLPRALRQYYEAERVWKLAD